MASSEAMVFDWSRRLNKVRTKGWRELEVAQFSWQEDYLEYLERSANRLRERDRLQRAISDREPRFSVEGYCYVCQRPSRFSMESRADGRPMWRERMTCEGCGLINRQRAAIHLLFERLGLRRASDVYLMEQSTRFYRWMSGHLDRLTGSEYMAGRPTLTVDPRLRHEDATALSFEDGSFDFVLSFECFEHIPSYGSALSESYRVLRPGGTLFFSVPFMPGLAQTLVRASVRPDGEIVHHEHPDYHGDPLCQQGCLCFCYFGWSLLADLRDVGFVDPCVLQYWSRAYGYLGESNLSFIQARKPS